MKKFLTKSISVFLTLTMMVSLINWTAEDSPVMAKSTTVNVYDATTFGEMLGTENVDIVLWQDIDYTGSDLVSCNSIDLNGYNLICSNTLTFKSGKRTVSILDSRYKSTSSNTATFSKSINIYDGTLRIESGVIFISSNGSSAGIYGTGNVEFIDGNITIKGADGVDGAIGKTGVSGIEGRKTGGVGGYGASASNGGDGINAGCVIFRGGNVNIRGGRGGTGGTGGTGGQGYDAHKFSGANPGKESLKGGTGGAGGTGGNGGDGGNGISASSVEVYCGNIKIFGGAGGTGGNGGTGGKAGKAGSYTVIVNNQPSVGTGSPGDGGAGGKGGIGGNGGSGISRCDSGVQVYGGTLACYGGSYGSAGKGGKGGAATGTSSIKGTDGDSGKVTYYGGAGIHAALTVEDGIVSATGSSYAAGIGGTGNGQGINGFDVNISGGQVTAKAGTPAFDIGGGYDGTKYGTAGKLIVTGGTLILSTRGRGTNATTPSFTNCTVSGSGAYQYEGTYNEDGKFTIHAVSLETDPETCLGYDAVKLIASFTIARTITTPSPRGYVSFKVDGEEIGTSPLKTAAIVENSIPATAELSWVAVEGEHLLTAEYVSGSGDSYAPVDQAEYKVFVDLHEHIWEENFTVDIQPDCITEGSKSIHCSLCDTKKDVTEIPALGHSFTKYLSDNNATCTVDGTETAKCDRCDATDTRVVPAPGHNYSADWTVDKAPTCTEPGSKSHRCTRCGDKADITEIPALGHSFTKYVSDNNATCTADGTETAKCDRCDVTDTRVAKNSALDHNYSADWTTDKAPTCTEPGSKSHHCSRCGDKIDVSEIPALGHSFTKYLSDNNATCTVDGTETAKCDRCDETDTRIAAGSALGHNYSTNWTVDKSPSCTQPGSKSHHCIRCGDKADVTEIPATGHTFGEWVVTLPPTSDTEGMQERTCTVCGETEQLSIPAIGAPDDEYLPGNVNGDGSVTSADALMALQAATDKIELTGAAALAADVNGDGLITSSDALQILQYATEKISSFSRR